MAPKETVWKLDLHTKAKHDLLREYLRGWMPVLGQTSAAVLFIDGFAGPGRYAGGEPGSPIIALDEVRSYAWQPGMRSTTFNFLFIEQDKSRAASLDREVAAYWSKHSKPPNVLTEVVDDNFEDAARAIVTSIRPGYRLVPTLAFVDPFGFSGVRLDTIKELLSFNRCELFINYMSDHVNRFATAGNVDDALSGLFGTSDYLNVDASNRAEDLRDLYMDQLRSTVGFEYVQDFGLDTGRGRPGYYLIHATRHEKGADLFRRAMWKIDPNDGRQYKHGYSDQATLIPPNEAASDAVFKVLRDRYIDTEGVSIEELQREVLRGTRAHPNVLKKYVLRPAEIDGLIEVTGRTRKYTYPARCMVRFLE